MTDYNKLKFVSPEKLFSKVKEELKSYFDTGVVDDILFPMYTEECLQRLGRVTYKVTENILRLNDFQAKLPEDFEAVRELWLCSSINQSYELPGAHYELKTFKVCSDYSDYDRCKDLCAPDEIKVMYKTKATLIQSFKVHHLLKPGNIHARDSFHQDCLNIYSHSNDTFDIRDNKIITNFREGCLYLVYYKIERDEDENQMIPDNIRVKTYIEAYLKYKCFEIISNQVTDETYKQIEAKCLRYERAAIDAYANASVEMKKQNIYQVIDSISRNRGRFDKFKIS